MVLLLFSRKNILKLCSRLFPFVIYLLVYKLSSFRNHFYQFLKALILKIQKFHRIKPKLTRVLGGVLNSVSIKVVFKYVIIRKFHKGLRQKGSDFLFNYIIPPSDCHSLLGLICSFSYFVCTFAETILPSF